MKKLLTLIFVFWSINVCFADSSDLKETIIELHNSKVESLLRNMRDYINNGEEVNSAINAITALASEGVKNRAYYCNIIGRIGLRLEGQRKYLSNVKREIDYLGSEVDDILKLVDDQKGRHKKFVSTLELENALTGIPNFILDCSSDKTGLNEKESNHLRSLVSSNVSDFSDGLSKYRREYTGKILDVTDEHLTSIARRLRNSNCTDSVNNSLLIKDKNRVEEEIRELKSIVQ